MEILFSILVVFGACIMLDFLYDDIKLMSNAGNQQSVLLQGCNFLVFCLNVLVLPYHIMQNFHDIVDQNFKFKFGVKTTRRE